MPVEQFGRPQPAGQQDRARRNRRPRRIAGERRQQPAGEVLEVRQPLAQIGIGDAAHAVVQLAGHPLHRRIGRQTAADHLGDAPQPAGIGGDQAIGVEHLARCRSRPRRRQARPARRRSARRDPAASGAPRRAAAPVPPPGRRPADGTGADGCRAAPPDRWRCRRPASHRRTRAAPWRRRPPATPSDAPLAASTSASSIATVSSSSTSSAAYSRGVRFCTATTPSVRPARRTGTASIEANGSSSVSGR